VLPGDPVIRPIELPRSSSGSRSARRRKLPAMLESLQPQRLSALV
jgi:hypothetical protein